MKLVGHDHEIPLHMDACQLFSCPAHSLDPPLLDPIRHLLLALLRVLGDTSMYLPRAEKKRRIVLWSEARACTRLLLLHPMVERLIHGLESAHVLLIPGHT